MKGRTVLSLLAVVFAACQDGSLPSRPDVGAPLFDHLTDPLTNRQDTYLDNTRKNDNFGDRATLSLVESAKNRILIAFDPATVGKVKNVVTATGGRALLKLTIATNPGDWGPTGRNLEVRVMTRGWTESGATLNCADDADLGNNRADCSGTDAWDVSKSATNPPWSAQPQATALITTGLTGVVEFDVTAHVNAGIPFGVVVMREDEQEAGSVSFWSFDNGDPELEPKLEASACPPDLTCGDTRVPLTSTGTNPDGFNVQGIEQGATIARLDVDKEQVEIINPPAPLPEELIFVLKRLQDDAGKDRKCLGLADPSLEVGPCWEALAIDPASGGEFSIRFKDPQRITACVPHPTVNPVDAHPITDAVRMVRREAFDPNNPGPQSHLPPEEPLEVLEPSVLQEPVNCDHVLSFSASLLESSPLKQLAGAVWNRVKLWLSPQPLHAIAPAAMAVWNAEKQTNQLDGLSFFSWAKLQVPYRDGDYIYATVGRKCETCDFDKVPADWFKEGAVLTGWNQEGEAAFGDLLTGGDCPLDASVKTGWPQADPRFNPPEITQVLLRKRFIVKKPDEISHPNGTIDLQVRAAVRNDIQVYLNGVNVTDGAEQPAVTNSGKDKGWIQREGGCAEYDEVIVRVPGSLLRFPPEDNLLAIRARSRADEPSFADIQVNVIEGN